MGGMAESFLGETVRTLLQRTHGLRRQIPISSVLAIIAGPAAGLHHAHERRGYNGKPLRGAPMFRPTSMRCKRDALACLPAAAEVRELVDAGQVVVADAHGFSQTVAVIAATTTVVEMPGAVAASVETPHPMVRRKTSVYGAYTLGGVGVASLTTGIVLGLLARGDYRAQIDAGHCTDESPPQCDEIGYSAQKDAVALANIGTGFGIAGLALIGAGAVVFLTAPRDVAVTPTVTERSAGLTVVGRF